eukprot:scaffold477326_cov37-Prasinocladus_malaysianus.AAC.1
MGPSEASVGIAARVLGSKRRLCTAPCTTSKYSYSCSYEFGELCLPRAPLSSPQFFVMLIFISRLIFAHG